MIRASRSCCLIAVLATLLLTQGAVAQMPVEMRGRRVVEVEGACASCIAAGAA